MESTLVLPRNNWNWRRNLLFLCVAVTETLWISIASLWLLLLLDDPFQMELNGWIPLIGANIAFGLFLRRTLIQRGRLTPQEQMPFIILGLLIVMAISIAMLPVLTGDQGTPTFENAFDFSTPTLPVGVILPPIVLGVFIRGMGIGRSQLTPNAVGILIRFGLMVIFLSAVFTILPLEGNVDSLNDGILTILPIFFFAALMASALARSNTLKLEDKVRQTRFGAVWLFFLTMISLILSGISFVVALLLAGVDREQVIEIVQFPFIALITLVFIIAAPFLYVAEIATRKLSELLADPTPPPTEEIEFGEREVRAASDNPQIDISDALADIADFLTGTIGPIIAIIIIVMVIGFWAALLFMRDRDNLVEDSESIGQRERAGGLRRFFGKRLRKLGDTLGLVRQFGLGRELFAAFTIRWAYKRMEGMGKKRGFPRYRSQTPYEYRHDLYKAFPDMETQVKTITEAYVAIRYGEIPENKQALDNVRIALDDLKSAPAIP